MSPKFVPTASPGDDFPAHFGFATDLARNVWDERRSATLILDFSGNAGARERVGEKAECPVRRSQTEVGAPFGALKADRSTTGRSTGINLHLDQFTSPVAFTSSSRNWPVWRGGRCRFSGTRCRQADSAPELSPFHADPVARAGANQNRPLGGQLGWPQILRLCTTAPSPCPDPKVDTRFGLPRRIARFPERPCRSPWPLAPRRDRSTRLNLTPWPVARIRCRLSVVRVSPEGAVRTRSEVAVNSVLFQFRCVS